MTASPRYSPASSTLSAENAALMDSCWRFGPYMLNTAGRRLKRDGVDVALGARSFDLLVLLLRRAGEIVSKAELLDSVWGGIVVDDSSVRVHISMLRKALSAGPAAGGDWIVNVPLRGYSFCGPVEAVEAVDAGAGAAAPVRRLPQRPPAGLPPRCERLFGRELDLERMGALLAQGALLTVIGAGGVGKTAAAVAAARQWAARHGGDIVFVDLAPAVSCAEVLAAFGTALGVPADSLADFEQLRARLARRDALLLLDNCEQALDALAPLVEALCAGPDGMRILATSREALRVRGETVYRLLPLPAPAPLSAPSLDEALRYPAVALFAARAAAAGVAPFGDEQAVQLATICQQLDGIPLAIELLAARLSVLSLSDLLPRWDEHMLLTTVGGRNVLARHQTMSAPLDWSLALLDDAELGLFTRLSVFCGPFELESALRVAGGELAPEAAYDALAGLVAKSLLVLDSHAMTAPYRLLTPTRAHATRLLRADGGHDAVRRRHAVWVDDLMSAALAELPAMSSTHWDARYGHLLADARAALDWAATAGEAALAVDLPVSSSVLWFHRSQLAEYRQRLARALAAQEQGGGVGGRTATLLRVALGNALWHTRLDHGAMLATFRRTLDDAAALGDVPLQLRAHWGVAGGTERARRGAAAASAGAGAGAAAGRAGVAGAQRAGAGALARRGPPDCQPLTAARPRAGSSVKKPSRPVAM